MPEEKKTLWYAAGLHFECMLCGRCADFLKIEHKQLWQKYLRRVGFRTTIIEQPATKDCIFLREIDGQKGCVIYPVRPSQCREQPFWPENLADADAWNRAAQRCSGINRGRLYSFEEIEKIRLRQGFGG
jgi:Fe-S-cluster containining protein